MIEQLNIWWSPTTGQWITCAWIKVGDMYRKERTPHYTLKAALEFVQKNYKEDA